MDPETNQPYPLVDLLACVAREVGLRKDVYLKLDKVPSLDQLSPKRTQEIALMEAVGERLTSLNQACLDFDKQVAALQAAHAPADDALLRTVALGMLGFPRVLIAEGLEIGTEHDWQVAKMTGFKNDAQFAKGIVALWNAAPALLARLRAAEAKVAELPKLQEFVGSLFNDLLNHPELPPSIHAKLWQLRQKLTVKGDAQHG